MDERETDSYEAGVALVQRDVLGRGCRLRGALAISRHDARLGGGDAEDVADDASGRIGAVRFRGQPTPLQHAGARLPPYARP